jgi:hypothetical protein
MRSLYAAACGLTLVLHGRELIPLGPGRLAVVLANPQISVAVIDAAAGTIVRHTVLDCPKKQR